MELNLGFALESVSYLIRSILNVTRGLYHKVTNKTFLKILLALDCRLNPNFCDPNASCVNTKKKTGGKYGGWVHRCACKNGYVGNGIICVEMSSGR